MVSLLNGAMVVFFLSHICRWESNLSMVSIDRLDRNRIEIENITFLLDANGVVFLYHGQKII